jgi:NADPH:quinone reductase-like Zn-dependent oxidoreductase
MRYGRIVMKTYGGPEVLEVESDEARDPGPGEVRIRSEAAGVGWVEYMLRHGAYPGQPRPPLTPGYDVVGRVEVVGSGVSRVRPGDRVAALLVTGGYSELVMANEQDVVPVPADVDPAAAVCLVLNYTTAYQMLHRVVPVASGARALVHSAAGGVGTALLDLGRLLHLQMWGTASAAKHPLVRRLGAEPIDYQRHDFVAELRRLAAAGVEVAFDPIGGRHWWRSRRCLRRGGVLVAYGSQAQLAGGRVQRLRQVEDIAVALALMAVPAGRRFRFYSITAQRKQHPDWFQSDLGRLFELLRSGQIHPVIAARLPWTAARSANELLETGRVSGKIVLLFGPAAAALGTPDGGGEARSAAPSPDPSRG